MANRSVLGLDNALNEAVQVGSDFDAAIAGDTTLFLQSDPAVPTVTRFIWAADYSIPYAASSDQLWVGAIADGDIRLDMSVVPRQGTNSSVVDPVRVIEMSTGVHFAPMFRRDNVPVTPGNLQGLDSDTYALLVGLSGAGRLVELWLGAPLMLPHQFQSGAMVRGQSQYAVESAVSHAGGFGGIYQSPKAGRLRVDMPYVDNEWLASNWYRVRRFISKNPFWYSLFDAPTTDFERGEVAFAYGASSPPVVNSSPTGFSTISLDALTHPDFAD